MREVQAWTFLAVFLALGETMKSFGWITALALFAAGCATQQDDALMTEAAELFRPIPSEAPARLKGSEELADLGKKLFFDPRLSSSGVFSCNSCHNLSLSGIDGRGLPIGHAWLKGGRNTPTVYNAVFNEAKLWDGRSKTVETHVRDPLANPKEMNNTPDRVVDTLRSIPGYVDAFRNAFPGDETQINFTKVSRAMDAFEATLITPDAPFDRFLDGDADALGAKQKEGLRLFMEVGCSNCHKGVNVGGHSYFKFGVVNEPDATLRPEKEKRGYSEADSEDDAYVFLAPSLRNVAGTPPYFHMGAVWDLKQAVQVMSWLQEGRKLTDAEADAIAAFLESLSGEIPEIVMPELPTSTAGTPRPN